MPRSIVHLTPILHRGHGHTVAELACAQRAAGDDVLVVASATGTFGYQNDPHVLNRLESADVAILVEDSLFDGAPALHQRVLAQLRRVRHADTVDVLHAHAAAPAAIALSFASDATARRPVVIQTQDGWHAKTPEDARRELDLLTAVDTVIVTSTATRDFLISAGIAPDCVMVIPNGLTPHAPRPLPAAVDTMKQIRGPGRVVVGCIGAVTENNNQALLLRALAVEPARSVHAVFIGDGGQTLDVRARALGVADRVHVVGYQAEAETWIGLFDAVIVPSRMAGRELVVLEAFRAGIPIVASNIPPWCELVTDYDTGWLFESDDARSLATAIGRATSIRREIRDRIVDAAARKFLAGYTTEVMVARHAELYDRVAGLLGR
jgi:glycosyltransferase involved in cell wall biosynthesis